MAKLPIGTDLQSFARLPLDADITTKIETKDAEIKATETASKQATEIKARGLLKEIGVPAFPKDLGALLAEKLLNLG